ncbi:MAG: lysozyme inhibitor LprI family protein [Paracoccaceae bacterium]
MRKPLLLVLFWVLSLPAFADPTMECDEPSQVEIAECVSATLDRVDGAVLAALGLARNAMAELDRVTGREVAAPALEQSQTAWAAFRDAQCEAVGASYGGGSGTGIAITACRIELGRARVTKLLNLAQ